jgi:hypothetical protein
MTGSSVQFTSTQTESDLPPNPATQGSPAQKVTQPDRQNIREGAAGDIKILSGSGSQRGFIVAKAPSNWRRGEASHNPPPHRMDLIPS